MISPEVRQQMALQDAFGEVTSDVERTIRKSGLGLNELMARFSRAGVSGPSDFMTFARHLKAKYLHKTANFRMLEYTRSYRLMCASTPTRGAFKIKYAHAVVGPPLTGKPNIVQMVAEGICAIDEMRHNVRCEQQQFDEINCRFTKQMASGNSITAASNIVFTKDVDSFANLSGMEKGTVVDVVGPDQKTNVSAKPTAYKTLNRAWGAQHTISLDKAIFLDSIPAKSELVILDVRKIQRILSALRKGSYPVVAFEVDCGVGQRRKDGTFGPGHAVFALLKIESDGTIVCRINDPNESSLQHFEAVTSHYQEKAYWSEVRKAQDQFLKPGERDISDDAIRYKFDLEVEKKRELKVATLPDEIQREIDFESKIHKVRLWEDRTYRYVDEDGDYADEFYKDGRQLTEADGLMSRHDSYKLADAPNCEHADNAPGGWCQTWSAFQAECAVCNNTFHDTLIRMASNSKFVEVRPGYRVYATWDEEGKALATLMAADPTKLHGVTEDGKTMLEWGCALNVFVRCIAARYLEFTFGMATPRLRDKVELIAKAFNLEIPIAHINV